MIDRHRVDPPTEASTYSTVPARVDYASTAGLTLPVARETTRLIGEGAELFDDER